jgi:hypothetical protein
MIKITDDAKETYHHLEGWSDVEKNVRGFVQDVRLLFISVRQDLIPEAVPSQEYRMNMGKILNGYGIMGIMKRNTRE